MIVPALECVGVDGRTTLDILRADNIRVDMFQRLLTADLVVADLSIDNANVFYEGHPARAAREADLHAALRAPPDQFIKASVRSAGPQWIKRFWRLRERLPERVLAESEELPRWLQEKSNYSIW